MATVDVYKIKVDVSGDQNIRGLQKDINTLEGGLNKSGKALLGFGAAAAAAFAAVGVSAFRMADNVVDSANGLGIAVDRFYQIGLAAEQSGIAFDDAAKFMGKFALAQDMAAKGSQDMQDDFAKVGITLEDLATLSDEDLFSKAVAGLAAMDEGAGQTATSMKLFGKAARDLNFSTFQEELRKNGEESKEAARLMQVGADAADSLERAFRQIQIISLRVFEPIIQGIADFDLKAEKTQQTIKLLGAGMAAIGSAILVANIVKLVGAFKQLSIAARAVAVAQTAVVALTGPAGWAVIAGATLAAAGAYKALDAALDGASDSAKDLNKNLESDEEAEKEKTKQKEIQAGTDLIMLQMAKDRVATSQQNLDLAKQTLQESIDFIGVETNYANLQKANLAAEATAKKEIQALQVLINQESAKGTSTSQEQIVIYKEQQDVISENVAGIKDLNQLAYERLEAEKEIALVLYQQQTATGSFYTMLAQSQAGLIATDLARGAITQETADRQMALFNAQFANEEKVLNLKREIATLDAVTDAAKIKQLQAQIDASNTLYEDTKKGIENAYAIERTLRESGTAGAVSALETIRASMEPFQLAQDAIMATWGNIGSAIDDMVDNGKSSFSDLADSIIKDLAKMIIKAYLFKYIFDPLMGAFGISGKAMGGPVDAGTPYIVGEKGPELFVPQGSGRIIPNHRLDSQVGSSPAVTASAGPITNNYITNNIQALDSKSVAQVFAENRESLLGTVEYARKETAYGV
jgi:hypothetical protein